MIESSDKFNSTKQTIPEKQEKVRGHLAIWFSIWYGLLLIFYILILIFVNLSSEQWNLLSVILSSWTWFVWTIIWFYFWQNSIKEN